MQSIEDDLSKLQQHTRTGDVAALGRKLLASKQHLGDRDRGGQISEN